MEPKAVAPDKDLKLIEIEIENCKRNIDFYIDEIENMERKIRYLEQLRENPELLY